MGVRARNANGWSGWRNSPSASPLVAPPSAVSWVSVERVCDHSFIIRWDSPPGATGYDVNFSQNGRKSWHRIVSNTPLDAYDVYGYDKNKTYHVAVREVNANGASGWTNSEAAPPPPCATGDLRAYYVAGSNSANSVRVFWASGKRATGYDVNFRENNGAEWQRIESDAPGNSYTIGTSADYHPEMLVAIRSRNGSMESEWRNAKATRLSASEVNASAATFTLEGHSGGWWLKRTSPTAGECVAGESDFSHRIGGLNTGTGYTFQAYGDSACQRDIGGVTFTTSASSVTTGSVSNLGEAANGEGLKLSASSYGAHGFTTGSNSSGYTLKSVTARFRASGNSNPGDITVAIHEVDSSNSSNPTSTALYTLSGDNPYSAGDYTYTCAVTNSVSCGLSANTTYFLVMRGSSTALSIGYFNLETTKSDNQTGDAGWAIGDVLKYHYNGWSDDIFGEIGLFRVTATANPNPILTASNVTKSGATLTISDHNHDWHYKADTGPDANCKGPVTGATRTLSGLTVNTTYIYTAYSDSGCATPLATAAAFTTAGLVSVSNLGEAANGEGLKLNASSYGAHGFTTGSNSSGYTLKSVTARFRASGNSNPGDITVAIHEVDSSNSSNPTSTALYTLSGDNPYSAGDYTYTCAVTNSVSCGLSANTTYFLVMRGSSTALSIGYFNLETTESDNQTGDAGWAIGDVLKYHYNGWSDDIFGEIGMFRVTAVEK